MNDAQRLALEGILGSPLTGAQVVELSPYLDDPDNRNDVRIAELLSGYQPDQVRSLRVDEVFDVFFASGDWATIKTAQMASNPLALMAFAALDDAKRLGSGSVNLSMPMTANLLDQLQAADPPLLSQAGRDALTQLSKSRPEPIQTLVVSNALNLAEGRDTL